MAVATVAAPTALHTDTHTHTLAAEDPVLVLEVKATLLEKFTFEVYHE